MWTAYEQIVNAHFTGDCLSNGQESRQISDQDGHTADLANDYGDPATYSCTLADEGIPWWAVDLGAEYYISSVELTAPDVDGAECNYRQSFIN